MISILLLIFIFIFILFLNIASLKLNKISNLKNNLEEIKISDYQIFYKVYKNVPDCILNPMSLNCIKRTVNFQDANLIWKLLKVDMMKILIKKLNKHQRYNHFPCTWELGRKDKLWKNFYSLKSIYPDEYNFIPETYIIPEDKNNFLENYKKNPEKNWIVKPVASSRGRGIRLLSNLNVLPKKCLVSNYIENPHLINNKKYDLRIYVLITSYNPLKIYLYQEGLVRFASEDYCNVNSINKHNRFIHLTNYSINKTSINFDNNISNDYSEKFTGSKWSLSAFRKYCKDNSLNFSELWLKIKDIVVKAIISAADTTIFTVKNLTNYRNNLFELYGFDIIIDGNFNPWLLEINLNPSLNCDTELDLKIKSDLMTDIYNIIGLIPIQRSQRVGKNDKKNNNNNKDNNNNYNNYDKDNNNDKDDDNEINDINIDYNNNKKEDNNYRLINFFEKNPKILEEEIKKIKNDLIENGKNDNNYNNNNNKDNININSIDVNNLFNEKELINNYEKSGLDMDISKIILLN